MKKIAILVDGGFYKKRAKYIFGEKTAEERADELIDYCMRHLKEYKPQAGTVYNDLYRIFYYDCPPSEKTVYHPLLNKPIPLKNSSWYKWNKSFVNALITKRKVAVRMGEILESSVGYSLKPNTLKNLCRGKIKVSDLKEDDFDLDIKQKGVDMRIGLDISSLANKRLVDTIVLIAGDSDFVPAAKYARREGIDFILDPLWQSIKPSLMEHIDGLEAKTPKPNSENNPDHLVKIHKSK